MSKKLTTKEFIERATLKHGEKFNYSRVRYVNNYSKIKIVCQRHGIFSQIPYNHLNGEGCFNCRKELQSLRQFLTKDEFINRSKQIHGNTYDYSNVNYVDSQTKVNIICKKHGEFLVTPNNHISKSNSCGCPKCRSSKGELKIIEWLNKNQVKYIFQKTFDDCRSINGRMLKFDFYIPGKNTLIEYDGEQHFRTGQWGKYKMTTGDLKKIKLRDNLKTKYANKNGLKIIRIKYTKIKSINQILNKI